ncbi:phage capsid protein [Clostridiales Family XIII bacterium ASD5510]|uniref:Phage capsid protein n=1 Tax=Hominibacterium faecale TaxID=2839743 RepID=A0A9J6QZG6_9FIRM|nr:phage capsid protein [Hominibacterium faecale]MCU7380842.1 phage capsid protein [Hominibacterium faecale]
MLEKLKSFWEGIKQMFTMTDIKRIAGRDVALSETMIEHIEEWSAMFAGKANWTDKAPSLRIEAGICREFADITINEMEATVDNETLDELFKSCIENLNENLQDGLALGSFIIKPFSGGGVEYVGADKFIPIAFDDKGSLRDCIFIQHKQLRETKHVFRTERHTLTDAGLRISNKAYSSSSKTSLGIEVPLTAVEGWEGYPEEVTYPGMDKMDFGFYRNPTKNRIDGSPCGVSIFDSAKKLIKKADIQGARVDWEFESGERAVHVDERALKKSNRTGMPTMGRLNQRLYRGLNLEQNQGELLKEYSPQLRNDGFLAGLESYFRRIEFAVGLAYGDLSNVQYVDKTATEIKTAKERKYNRVSAIQTNLKKCLEGLVDALAFYNAMYTTSYTLTCNFNDSILTDEETERNQDRQDVAMGVMRLEEYRAKWYGEDLETAAANLPEQTNPVLDNLPMGPVG